MLGQNLILCQKMILSKKNSPGQCAAYVLVAAICVAAVDFAFDGLEMIVRLVYSVGSEVTNVQRWD